MRTFAKLLIYCSKLLSFSFFHFRLGKRLSHWHTHTHTNYNLWPCHILLNYFCGVSSYLFNFQDKPANQKTRLCKWPQQHLNVTTHIPGVHSLRHSSCWRSVNKNIVIIPAPLGSSALLPSPLFPSPLPSAPHHSPPFLIATAPFHFVQKTPFLCSIMLLIVSGDCSHVSHGGEKKNDIRNTVNKRNNCIALSGKVGFQAEYDTSSGFNSGANDCQCECLSEGLCVMTKWVEHLISSEPSDACLYALWCWCWYLIKHRALGDISLKSSSFFFFFLT